MQDKFDALLTIEAIKLSCIVENKIDCVIFFIDPLSSHPHEVDVQMLLRICNVTDTPIATNYSTSSKLVKYFENE